MKSIGNNKSKDKGRPKSHSDPTKQKSMEYVQDITSWDDIIVNEAVRDEYSEFIIDPNLLTSEHTSQVPHEKQRIPVKVLKVIPSSKTQKAKSKEKVLVARAVPTNVKPFCKLEQKERSEESIKPYSIIGTLEEYRLGESMKHNEPSKIFCNEEPVIPYYETEIKHSHTSLTDDTVHIDEKNALNNWTKQMNARQKQQEHLSKHMDVSSETLLINQNDLYRSIQEERTLIDRAMPSKDYGKGYRVGSEFWKQTETLRSDERVNITLTETEKGNVPSVEHVGYPSTIKKEMGNDWKRTSRMMCTHYPWWKSEYLHERQQHLQNVIDELNPHKADLDGLEIIGKSVGFDISDVILESGVDEMFEEEINDDNSSTQRDPLVDYDNVIPQSVFGPSLSINGHSAQWQNNADPNNGVTIRLLFTSEIGSIGKKTIQIKNDGTTVIHYLWKKLPEYNPFHINKGRPLNRFFFNINDGVILPGNSVDIPFIFKSPNGGIFTETWQLETLPVLCGKEIILITLHGIATESDKYEEDRKHLDRDLQDKQNKVMTERILIEILASIKTPERPITPVGNYVTEDEMFNDKNEKLHFKMESVNKLKEFHKEFNPGTEWDLSLNSLISNVASLEEEEEKEVAFQKVNEYIKELNYPNNKLAPNSKYDACYLVLCDTFDKCASKAQKLNVMFGLPEKELVIKSSEMSTKKNKKGDGDITNKSRTETRMTKKEASAKKTSKEKGKREVTNANRPTDLEGESNIEIAEKPVNNNYIEKLYMEVYDCLSEMAINLESVLSS